MFCVARQRIGEKCDRHPINNNSHVHSLQLSSSNPTNYEQR